MPRMAQLTVRTFRRALRELAGRDAVLGAIVERHGVPEFWHRSPGFPTLLLLILEQQVSLASAKAAFDKVDRRLGGVTPQGLLTLTDQELRADGFSRQKTRYARALAAALTERELDLDALADLDDVSVRETLTALPGIGPWTAEVYLLSALRRPDTWPTGDLALQEAARTALSLDVRPTPLELEEIGERWRPHRATAARLLWHRYLSERRGPRVVPALLLPEDDAGTKPVRDASSASPPMPTGRARRTVRRSHDPT
jgi:DNA-3-methyladenine glycosylase II